MLETNHKKLAHKLKKRGWDKHSISHSVKILKKAKKKKSKKLKKLDNLVYWSFLVLLILGNAMIFFGIIPILIYSPDWVSLLVIGILGDNGHELTNLHRHELGVSCSKGGDILISNLQCLFAP